MAQFISFYQLDYCFLTFSEIERGTLEFQMEGEGGINGETGKFWPK